MIPGHGFHSLWISVRGRLCVNFQQWHATSTQSAQYCSCPAQLWAGWVQRQRATAKDWKNPIPMSAGKNSKTPTGSSDVHTRHLSSGIKHPQVSHLGSLTSLSHLRLAGISVNSVPQKHRYSLSYFGDKQVYNSRLFMLYLFMLNLFIYCNAHIIFRVCCWKYSAPPE